MNRFLGGLTKSVRKPWHIYPIGVLFGLGFDTATEVGLLVLAGGAAAFNLPFYAILVLPILFAAGMCLMDTVDGVFMNAAYGWAFAKPVRKVFYNITITAISVAVALIIGTIELIGVSPTRPTSPAGRWPRSPTSRWTTPATASSALFVVSWAGRAGGLAVRPHRGALVLAPRGLSRIVLDDRVDDRAALPVDIDDCQHRYMSKSLLELTPVETVACCAPLTSEPLSAEQAERIVPLFKALADPARLRLLSLVASHRTTARPASAT